MDKHSAGSVFLSMFGSHQPDITSVFPTGHVALSCGGLCTNNSEWWVVVASLEANAGMSPSGSLVFRRGVDRDKDMLTSHVQLD